MITLERLQQDHCAYCPQGDHFLILVSAWILARIMSLLFKDPEKEKNCWEILTQILPGLHNISSSAVLGGYTTGKEEDTMTEQSNSSGNFCITRYCTAGRISAGVRDAWLGAWNHFRTYFTIEISMSRSIGLVNTRGSMIGLANGEVVLIDTVPWERGFLSAMTVEGSPLKNTSRIADFLEAMIGDQGFVIWVDGLQREKDDAFSVSYCHRA